MGTIAIYDCGCVASRPRDQNCKSFGTRWRAYTTEKHIILKCRDCGRMHHFELRRDGLQVMMYSNAETKSAEESLAEAGEILQDTKKELEEVSEDLERKRGRPPGWRKKQIYGVQ